MRQIAHDKWHLLSEPEAWDTTTDSYHTMSPALGLAGLSLVSYQINLEYT